MNSETGKLLHQGQYAIRGFAVAQGWVPFKQMWTVKIAALLDRTQDFLGKPFVGGKTTRTISIGIALLEKFPDDLRLRRIGAQAVVKTSVQKAAKPAKTKVARKAPNKYAAFYRSAAWKKMRYRVLIEDGSKCKRCGTTPDDGGVMNVDHKEPLSRRWDLRLERTNLRVLCSTCNWGKGSDLDEEFSAIMAEG